MEMTDKERFDFVERMIAVLASGIALNLPDQVRAATVALAKEFDVPLPAEFPRE
jgi:hypothetical protein